MSFFARLGSDSESDSSGSDSEESILSGDEGEEQDQRMTKTNDKANKFLMSDGDDSDEDSDDDEDSDAAPKGGKGVCVLKSRKRLPRANVIEQSRPVLDGRLVRLGQ
jgi:hypothetical protein